MLMIYKKSSITTSIYKETIFSICETVFESVGDEGEGERVDREEKLDGKERDVAEQKRTNEDKGECQIN